MNPYDPKATPHPETKCTQCGQFMNPVQRLLGTICRVCTRANHKATTR